MLTDPDVEIIRAQTLNLTVPVVGNGPKYCSPSRPPDLKSGMRSSPGRTGRECFHSLGFRIEGILEDIEGPF